MKRYSLKGKGTPNKLKSPVGGGGVDCIALHSLDLDARRGWVVSTTPWLLYPQERPGNHCTGSQTGPKAVLSM
jgi:hypothetical protein